MTDNLLMTYDTALMIVLHFELVTKYQYLFQVSVAELLPTILEFHVKICWNAR